MDLLNEVKNRMLISGDFHNAIILSYIEDIKQYMTSAGVDETIVNSKKSIGCIARGVNDLFNQNEFSDFFKQRVIQLSLEEPTDEEEIPLLSPTEPNEGDSEDGLQG